MSNLTDYFREQELIAEISSSGLITRESLWKTREGVIVAIKDMADTHLLNLIRVLQNRSPHGTIIVYNQISRRRLLNTVANEAYRRGLELI